jgi:serine protease
MLSAEIRSRFATVRDPEVIEILPDRIFLPALAPTDPQYVDQWYEGASDGINAPAAWDITTGSSNLVIGVIDTGKLPHEELASRWVGGYDLVSLSARENDTDVGRDADASDPGDWVTPAENSSGPLAGCAVTDSRWHGTLMAGVIAASANNGVGVAGLNWNSKLLPVRVVGKCGGEPVRDRQLLGSATGGNRRSHGRGRADCRGGRQQLGGRIRL